MWDELNAIAWAELEHNYGSAADVPRLMRECTDPDRERAGKAQFDLFNHLHHQGGWICSAAVAALPFLLRLLEMPGMHDRAFAVDLIRQLGQTAVEAEPRHVDPGWPAAFAAVQPELLDLLDDADPEVRRQATLLVSCGGLPLVPAARALARRWRHETDRVTRWDLLQAFGVLCAGHPGHPDTAALHAVLVRHVDDDPDPQTRLACVHALADADPSYAVARLVSLIETVQRADAADWLESAWLGGSRKRLVNLTAGLLRDDPAAATAYTLAMGGATDTEHRVVNLGQAADLAAKWRSVGPALLPFFTDQLDDPEPEIRYRAAYLLGCLGTEAAAAADRLAALTADPAMRDSRAGCTVGDAAVWALARMGDPRCVPGLAERLTGDRLGFPTHAGHIGTDSGFTFWLPGIHEVLSTLGAYAAELAVPTAARLRLPPADRWVRGNLCEVIAGWGPAAHAAVPVLLDLLEQEDVRGRAAQALGGIGAAAAPAADALRRRAQGSGEDAAVAAWAWWRTGVDPEPARQALLRHAGTATPRPELVRLIGDLAELGDEADLALRRFATAGDEPVRAAAAYALWRRHGESDLAAPILNRLARKYDTRERLPVTADALVKLAEIGAADEHALAIAREILSSPHRLGYFGDWRIFAEDEQLRAAAAIVGAG
ncbi:hypothetical protein Cs7R123_52380 [Catellatospora sp. TT07R-123]|uniref:hypothetical protein n=1 Tax=Catellatospora sp. TT07R-123 TaxID=2733863 RepID=UPI001B2169BB|nr:hypothetical protein [Catellatospora sp. TT07R-123]GHJ47896.1 hypothetical protein Cs7R123_52380 [Catellatospora sp. TT07R-123]